MNDPSQALNRSFGIWPPPHPSSEDPMGFANPVRLPPPFAAPGGVMHSRMNWNAKKDADKRKMATGGAAAGGVVPMGGGLAPLCGGGVSGYKPPSLNELQFQNRVKARRFSQKKKFPRFAPFAPRNTTSFIIRAKKSGGIASQVSPYPVTPAVLPTPKLSPTREVLADMVKEEWGVDGYGSMKGRIRLRSPRGGYEIRPGGSGEDDVEDEEGSSESDVEEHLEVERRLDHDVSRFEMVYPREQHGLPSEADLLEIRMDDQDARIARLEEENLTLKERLFLVERDMGELRRRLHLLQPHGGLLEREVSSNNDDDANNHNKNNNSDTGNAMEVPPPEVGDGDGDDDDDVEGCSAGSSGNPTLE